MGSGGDTTNSEVTGAAVDRRPRRAQTSAINRRSVVGGVAGHDIWLTRRHTSACPLIECVHVKSRARLAPRTTISAISASPDVAWRTPFAISSAVGGTKSPPSPTTSGSELVSAATTGVRAAMPSRAGNPNPSSRDGMTSADARAIRPGIKSSPIRPIRRVRGSVSKSAVRRGCSGPDSTREGRGARD